MDAQHHALLFRRLAEKCGGIPKIVELKVTRLGAAQLYRFADPNSGCYAPADVIHALQVQCGEASYSEALTEALPAARLVGDLLQEACETSVSVAELVRLVMQAKTSTGITPRIRGAILQAIDHVAEELRDVRNSVDQAAAAASGDAS